MADSNQSNFNSVVRHIIKKSLFTERQIEIISNQMGLQHAQFAITKGAYYRQVGQSRDKMVALFYTVVLLRGLGILVPDNIDVILQISDQVSVIKDGDVFPEKEKEVIDVIEKLIQQMVKL